MITNKFESLVLAWMRILAPWHIITLHFSCESAPKICLLLCVCVCGNINSMPDTSCLVCGFHLFMCH